MSPKDFVKGREPFQISRDGGHFLNAPQAVLSPNDYVGLGFAYGVLLSYGDLRKFSPGFPPKRHLDTIFHKRPPGNGFIEKYTWRFVCRSTECNPSLMYCHEPFHVAGTPFATSIVRKSTNLCSVPMNLS